MNPSEPKGAIGWTALLADPGGPTNVHGTVLELARTRAAAPRTGAGERVLAGVDEALAAIAILQGPAACRETVGALQPVAARVARKLSVAPATIDPLSLTMLFSVATVAETLGTPFELPPFDEDARLDDLLVARLLSPGDRSVIALVSLGRGRTRDVELLFRPTPVPTAETASGDPIELCRLLAAALEPHASREDVSRAWNLFVRNFPRLLKSGKAQWRHLLLAARVVMGRIEGVPMGEVADALHTRVEELAREEAG